MPKEISLASRDDDILALDPCSGRMFTVGSYEELRDIREELRQRMALGSFITLNDISDVAGIDRLTGVGERVGYVGEPEELDFLPIADSDPKNVWILTIGFKPEEVPMLQVVEED